MAPRKSVDALVTTLKVAPEKLREVLGVSSSGEDSASQDAKDVQPSPDSASQAAPPSNANGDNAASDSNAATPQAEGTPAATVPEGKKKGVKRSADKANGVTDGVPKQRGKPGPKKKPRLEDGTIDHANAASRAAGGHKLGPKANQGAINAGLRALDRSGAPCRKWAKGGFTLKSFTGVVWEVKRWTAPPKKAADSATEDSAVPSAADSSNKENKENGPEVNSASNSNNGADAEMQSPPSARTSSPAPAVVTAAA